MRKIAILLILALVLPFAGCAKKTTLDKVGSAVVVGVRVYLAEIEGLRQAGRISDAKAAALKTQGEAIQQRAEAFKALLANIGEVTQVNVKQVTGLITEFISFANTTLQDPEIVKLPTDSKILKTLRDMAFVMNQANIAISILFPDTTSPVTAQAAKIAPRGIPPSKIVINLE